MHNIKLIRQDSNLFTKKLSDRNIDINLKNVLDLDKENRKLIQKYRKIRTRKKNNIKKKR